MKRKMKVLALMSIVLTALTSASFARYRRRVQEVSDRFYGRMSWYEAKWVVIYGIDLLPTFQSMSLTDVYEMLGDRSNGRVGTPPLPRAQAA